MPLPPVDEKMLVAYALGYHDGRAKGVRTESFEDDDRGRYFYNLGYDRGVFDYSELDTEQEVDA